MKNTYKRIRKMSSIFIASAMLASGLFHSANPAAANASLNGQLPVVASGADLDLNSFQEFTYDWKKSLSQFSEDPAIVFISPDIDTSSTEPVSVIIQLSGQPAAVGKYAASKGYTALAAEATAKAVQNEQTVFLKAAKKDGMSLDVEFQYNQVLNGMAVTLPGSRISNLAKLPGVKAIYPNLTYTSKPIQTSDEEKVDPRIDMVPLQQLGVESAWAEGYTGKGLKIGVIDTGIDYLHPDLKDAFKGGYDSYYNDDDPYEDLPESGGTMHGTHVSGTIAGRAANAKGSFLQKGVAYESDLYVYKVLGGPQSYGTSAMIVDGIEHAVKDGMDVINLSLGDDGSRDPHSAEAIAVNNAALAGVIPVLAAGNAAMDAPYYYSLGAPSTAELGITVGAATSEINTYQTVATSSLSDQDYTLRAMVWEPGNTDFTKILGTDPIEAVYLGFGDDGGGIDVDYAGKDVEGKIVIVTRTHIGQNLPFGQQIMNAKEHGAKAIIIFNGTTNDRTDFFGDRTVNLSDSIPGRDGFIGYMGFQGEYSDSIPAFDIAGKEGRALVRAMMKQPDVPVTLTFAKPFEKVLLTGDTIAEFSSRGPNNDGRFGIKPDVVAPGHRIRSSIPAYGIVNPEADYTGAYGRESGTSMAAPHISGLALLLKDKFPNWTPSDVRAALANTADLLSDEDGTLYDTYSQGAGRPDISNALHTSSLLKALNEIKIYDKEMNPITLPSEASSVSFGIIDPTVRTTASSPLQLKSVTDKPVTYTARVGLHDVFTNKPGTTSNPNWDGVSVKLTGIDADGKVSVNAGEIRTFTLSVEVKPDAKQGVYEGGVILESSGVPALHLPFVFHIGKQSIQNENAVSISVSNRIVSPHAPIDITLNHRGGGFNKLLLDIYGNDGQYYGRIADFNGVKNGLPTYLQKGDYVIEDFNGSYSLMSEQENGESGIFKLSTLPDGQYVLIAITASVVFGSPTQILMSNITINVDNDYKGNDEQPGGGNPPGGDPGGEDHSQGSSGTTYTPTPTPTPNKFNAQVTASVVKESQTSTWLDAKASKADGVLAVTVNDADLSKVLGNRTGPIAIIAGVSSTETNIAELRFTLPQAQSLKAAPEGSSVVFTWNDASIALPTSALSGVPEGAGLLIRIRKEEASAKRFEASYPEAEVVGTPVAFEANVVMDNRETPIPLSTSERVARAFLVGGDVNATTAGALYEAGGVVHPVPAIFTASKDGGTIISITRPGFSTLAAAKRDIAFTDIDNSWAKEYIQKLADKFMMNGVTYDTFAPMSSVTRAQFTSMLVRAVGLPSTDKGAPFKDVSENDWFAGEVAAAHAVGLVTGYDGTFMPNANISRQDLAVMLNRALKFLDAKPLTRSDIVYTDAETFGAYAKGDIQAVTEAGLMDGVADQGAYVFHPAEVTTREAAAKVLYQLLKVSILIN
ncbi:S8 family serine peptidase [Paenibacillus silvestris]|uniref:S8 family serine peptidase n=1 Tax=Paenibacillus silvestris TaxID=2606219 RepID=UPI0013730BEF|nr:S8 family serine peptidase [Paenibacillus silvestris]